MSRSKGTVILAAVLFCSFAVGLYLGDVGWAAWLTDRLHMSRTAPTQPVLPDSALGNVRLFILAGQSNMSGRGELDTEARKPVPGAFLFGNDYRWRPLREPSDSPEGQVDRVSKDPVAGVSPARSFAEAVRNARPKQVIGMIPCAKGGSSLAEWQPSRHETTLYGSCLKRIAAVRPVGRVAGLLFFQGETDALTSPTPASSRADMEWGTRFEVLVRRWRSDVGRPNLPVVFAQIGSLGADSSRFSNWTAVQRSQARVQLPLVRMIRTKGLSLRDAVHYTSTGYRAIGKRFAEAWLQLTEASDSAGFLQDTPLLPRKGRAAPSEPIP